ncbi:MAG: DUF1622 domain-containing protein [Anaerolineae bacterium]|nr:DUF1622 domain-containing protein [Anaerolineae bacterium]
MEDGLLAALSAGVGLLEEALRSVVAAAVVGIEMCGALVIVAEVIRTIYYFIRGFFGAKSLHMSRLRMQLGQSMVMGLEFQVAADILKTALSPEWNDILLLAALIALRTVLNYLLEREIEHLNLEWIPGLAPGKPGKKA